MTFPTATDNYDRRFAEVKLQVESEQRIRAEIATEDAYHNIDDLQSEMQQVRVDLDRLNKGTKLLENELEHERQEKMKAEDLLSILPQLDL